MGVRMPVFFMFTQSLNVEEDREVGEKVRLRMNGRKRGRIEERRRG